MGKSFILSEQFRSPEELEELRRRIRAGDTLEFDEKELSVAAGIGNWNAAVTLSFLVAAALFGLLFALVALGISGGLSPYPWAGLGVTALLSAAAIAWAFGLLRHVDGMVLAARNRIG